MILSSIIHSPFYTSSPRPSKYNSVLFRIRALFIRYSEAAWSEEGGGRGEGGGILVGNRFSCADTPKGAIGMISVLPEETGSVSLT